jgi:hypothetical protein
MHPLEVDLGLLAEDEEDRPFLSLTNRFFVWPPGISPRKACNSSTVWSGGCSTVAVSTLRRWRKAMRSSGEAGINAVGCRDRKNCA